MVNIDTQKEHQIPITVTNQVPVRESPASGRRYQEEQQSSTTHPIELLKSKNLTLWVMGQIYHR